MKRLKRHNVTPPGGWKDVEPLTGTECDGYDLPSLVLAEKRVLQTAGKEVPSNLSDIIEDRICNRLDRSKWQTRETGGAVTMTTVDYADAPEISDVARALDTLLPWTVAGRPLVSIVEQRARTEICAACPYNVLHKPCGMCAAAYTIVRLARARRHVEKTGALRVCKVCKCDNRVSVVVPDRFLVRSLSDPLVELTWDRCWKREIWKNKEKLS